MVMEVLYVGYLGDYGYHVYIIIFNIKQNTYVYFFVAMVTNVCKYMYARVA